MRGEINSHTEEQHLQSDTNISRHTEHKRSIPFHFTNNAILRGLNSCSPQNDCKVAFTEPSRGMSGAKVEQTSAETLSFRCVCERCRLMRGDVGKSKCKVAFTFAEGATHVAHWKNSRKIAFTLAEVLITLGIIGVVAAMTISTLVTNARAKALQTGLQKAYSTLSQAIIMYENDNGMPITSAFGLHELKPALMKYIITAKDCGWGTDPDKACMPSKNYVSDKDNYKDIYKTFNGKNHISYSRFDDGQFVMNDSMFVMIENVRDNADTYISVDVNGYNKKPNRLGQDLFMFQINSAGKLVPMGTVGTFYNTGEYCSLSNTDIMNGAGCTIKALTDKDFFKNLPR